MEFVFVGKIGSSLPSEYTFYEEFDEVGLEKDAIHPPHCSGQKNIVLFNFSVSSALKFAFPFCDCMATKVYVLFDSEEKISEFLDGVIDYKKRFVKRI